MELAPTDWAVARCAWDPVRLWELQAEHPEVTRAELADAIERLLRAGLLQGFPTREDGPTLSTEEAVRHVTDETQWLDLVENPWPGRGPIYDFVLTESGRDLLRAK